MKRNERLQALTGMVSIAALVTLVGVNPIWLKAVLALLIGGSVYFWVVLDRKKQQEHSQALLVETVNHYRHDWMNDFQVILGYMRLKKYESLEPYMDKIKMKLHQESCLSKLGSPSLVAFLMSYRTTRPQVELDIAIEQEIQLDNLPLQTSKVTKMLCAVIEAINSCAIPPEGEPNLLSLELDKEDQALLLDFVYDGQYDVEKLRQAVGKVENSFRQWAVVEQQLDDDKAAITLRLPFEQKKG